MNDRENFNVKNLHSVSGCSRMQTVNFELTAELHNDIQNFTILKREAEDTLQYGRRPTSHYIIYKHDTQPAP